jgi:hypothetical protein
MHHIAVRVKMLLRLPEGQARNYAGYLQPGLIKRQALCTKKQ